MHVLTNPTSTTMTDFEARPNLFMSRALQSPLYIPIESNVHLVRFAESKKAVVAYGVAKQAWSAGELHEHSRIFVSSSGSFGLGWARVAKELGLPMTLVTQPSIKPLLPIFRGQGVEVRVVEEPRPSGGFQQARLNLLQDLAAEHPHPFIPHPYDDPRIISAYRPVARRIVDMLGKAPEIVVDVTGSSGSLMGLSQAFRREAPRVRAVAVDTYGSCLFGHPVGNRSISGMGNSVMPGILDHEAVDQVHWMPASDVNTAARQLLREHGLFMGPTTGAAVRVGKWLAGRNLNATVLCVGADSGWRYKGSVFCGNNSKAPEQTTTTRSPDEVYHPLEATPRRWCYMQWARRSLNDVLSGSSPAKQDSSLSDTGEF